MSTSKLLPTVSDDLPAAEPAPVPAPRLAIRARFDRFVTVLILTFIILMFGMGVIWGDDTRLAFFLNAYGFIIALAIHLKHTGQLPRGSLADRAMWFAIAVAFAVCLYVDRYNNVQG